MKSIVLLPLFILFSINSNSSIWNTILERTIVLYYETKADKALKENNFKDANNYYKKALSYTESRQRKGELFFKISRMYFWKSRVNPEKKFSEIYKAVSKLRSSKKKLTIFPVGYSALEDSILIEARKLIDFQYSKQKNHIKLASNVYQISNDEFDLVKLIHLEFNSKIKESYELVNVMVYDTAKRYNHRRDVFHNLLIKQAIQEKDYSFLKTVEESIYSSSQFTEKVDSFLLEEYYGIIDRLNFDTLDVNRISYSKLEQYLNLRNELVQRELIEGSIDSETRYMTLCCMKYCVDNYYLDTDTSKLWLLKLHYEDLLPNESVSFFHSSGVVGDAVDWSKKDSVLNLGQTMNTPLYYKANFSKSNSKFTNYLSLFTKNLSSKKTYGFSIFERDVLSNIDPQQELLKISKIDPLHAYKLVYYSSWDVDRFYVNRYLDGKLFENLSIHLNINLLKHLNGYHLDSALTDFYNLLTIGADVDKVNLTKAYNSYFKLLDNLHEEKDFSNAYEMYIVLSNFITDDFKLVASKKELIQKDWELNYVSSYLNDEDYNWTGDFENCECGKMPDSYYLKMRNKLAFFRRLSEMPDNIIFNDEYNRLAQEAALINSFGKLSHHPISSRKCYSDDGYKGSSSSNLSSGVGVLGYMVDHGESNKSVGHRRWILNPYNSVFGIGGTYQEYGEKWDAGYSNRNRTGGALYVFGRNDNNSRRFKDYSYSGVAWPMKGYFPYEFTFKRWSYSLDGADFSHAKVLLKLSDGTEVRPIMYPVANGSGLNTIVWEYNYSSENIPKYVEVQIVGVVKNGETKSSEIKYKIYPFKLDKNNEDYGFWVKI